MYTTNKMIAELVEFRSMLIKAIKTSVRKYAVKYNISNLYILPFGDFPVVCDDEQYQLDCFYFSNIYDIQLRLITMNNETDADAILEELTTDSLIEIALNLNDENIKNVYKKYLIKVLNKSNKYDEINNYFVTIDDCKLQLLEIFKTSLDNVMFKLKFPIIGEYAISIDDMPLKAIIQIMAN